MDENLGGIRVVRAFAAPGPRAGRNSTAPREDALELAAPARRHPRQQHQRHELLVLRRDGRWCSGSAASKVIAGEMTVGTLAAFLTFMTILQMPVRQLGLMVNSFARASTCGTRLFELLDLELDDQGRARTPSARGHRGRAALRECRLRAIRAPATPSADRHVSFEARPGETIGIVGPPGSGKSTIAHLIPRFYDVTGGTITIDGQDIRKVDAASRCARRSAWCSRIVPVHHHDREQHRLWRSLGARSRASSAPPNPRSCTTTSSGLPTGYNTVVGERGVSLSGGQRQRLDHRARR